jgi:hypothetical protein
MTETQQLIARIDALAEKTGKAPSTLSAVLLGSGKRLSELKEGRTITLAIYERALAKLADMEAASDQAEAA